MEPRLAADELRRHIVRTKRLPTIPIVLSKILDLVEDVNSSVFDLEEVISRDQSIAAKVLGLANSAFYGFGRKINTISQAIIVIGFNAVKSLAVGVSIFDKFYTTVRGTRLDLNGLWMHSVATAECTRLISQRLRRGNLETSFICGLLHDLGKVAFISILPDDYQEAVAEATRLNRRLYEVEQEAFGVGHDALGAWVAERWHLPSDLVRCLHEHHNPAYAGQDAELVHTVGVADYLSKKLGLGSSLDPVLQPLAATSLRVIGLAVDQLPSIEAALLEQRERIEQFFTILK